MENKNYHKQIQKGLDNNEQEVLKTMSNIYFFNPDRNIEIISSLFLILLIRKYESVDNVKKYIKEELKDETLTNHFKEYLEGNRIQEITSKTKKFSEELIKAAIINFYDTGLSDENATSIGLSNLAIELLDIKKEDIVIDLGSGINEFLIQSNLTKGVKKLYGVELNRENYIIGRIRSLLLEIDIHNRMGDILSQNFEDIKGNKVFSNPPIALRWNHINEGIKGNEKISQYFKGTTRTISGDWAFVLSAINNTAQNGKAAVLISDAGTWNKADKIIRKRLIEEEKIEGVILLPSKLLKRTSISMTMIILSENNKSVKMFDASDFFTEGRSNNILTEKDIKNIIKEYSKSSNISKLISVSEISKNDYILNPVRYLGDEVPIENPIMLGDIVKSITRGSMKTKEQLDSISSVKETKYQHLMLRDIDDGVISKNLPFLLKLDKEDEKYCVKNNSLIISKISPFKVALAKIDKDKEVLAAGNLYMLEIDETKANPIYVELFLQSELGALQLEKYAKGVAIRSISIEDLKRIKIPNVSLKKQNEIANEATELRERLDLLEMQIEVIKDRKNKLI